MFLITPRFQCLCLLLFLATNSVLSQSKTTSFQDFLKRHQNNPKTSLGDNNTYCSVMMRQRGLKCQSSNTFIHGTEQQLISICNSKGKILEGTHTSKTLFPITICKRRRGFKGIMCKYKGKSKIRKIRVTCEKGFPVHYISSV